MCLGETGNNQGDSFVYDGKIPKSKRKLLEGGINVFTSSFLRAKHIRGINSKHETLNKPLLGLRGRGQSSRCLGFRISHSLLSIYLFSYILDG